MKSSIIKNQASYDRISKAYAHSNYEDSAKASLGNEIKKIKNGGLILDFGCGPGNNFPLLLGIKPEQIIAVDLSEGMINEAKARYKSINNIKYIVSSFQNFTSEIKFNFILAHLSFVHLPINELEAVLVKLRLMLAKGGIFFANYFEGDDETKELISEWGDQKDVHRDFSFYQVNTLKEIYKKAGLKIYKMTQKRGGSFNRINIFASE